MSKICPCLWFDGEAEEAATLYVSLLPDSGIETIQRNSIDSPAGKAGSVLVVEFTLAGQRFMALNGGMRMEYTHAVSFKIDCATRPRSTVSGTRSPPMAGRPNVAAGSAIVTASIGRSCLRRCRNIWAERIARAHSAQCRRCSE